MYDLELKKKKLELEERKLALIEPDELDMSDGRVFADREELM